MLNNLIKLIKNLTLYQPWEIVRTPKIPIFLIKIKFKLV